MNRQLERSIEQEIERLIGRLYWHIDHRDFVSAVEIYTEDAVLIAMDVQMNGRAEVLEALEPALGTGTIRHVATNLVVNVVDADHATCDFYTTIYYARDAEFETAEAPIPFDGPQRTHDIHDQWRRTTDGWRIYRRTGETIFHRDNNNPTKLENWAKSVNKQ